MKNIIVTCLMMLVGMYFQQCAPAAEKEKGAAEANTEQKGRAKWTKEEANAWYAKQGWLVGCDFVPSTAINQLEMWQAATFDTATIDRELGWAASIGMNTVRVYLHDLLYKDDAAGFLSRMDQFLEIASRHRIKPLFVLFDSVWDPFPKSGPQRAPKPHVHNSGWVQNPGKKALLDSTQYPRLEAYAKGVVGKFANDDRVLGWDIWNEPENMNNEEYRKSEPANKAEIVMMLMKEAFEWARSAGAQQPLTAGLWSGEWSSPDSLKPIEKAMIEESDVISFHNYENAASFEKDITDLQQYGRPLLCTEYMARGNNSTFEGSLPVAKKYNVGAYNWGLVDGKSQTIYPWDSWKKTYAGEPDVWFHDIFRKDGTPYRKAETDLIKSLTGKS
ncbi:MAG TPA: cellulase family glycosylhydrolase [Agriterribacter sp.]|nr:cellulase family glycosylhydrolase [Agriterribacter sp.]